MKSPENFQYMLLSMITTSQTHRFSLKGLWDFLSDWDWHNLLKESFIYPLVGFVVLKVVSSWFGVSLEKIALIIRPKWTRVVRAKINGFIKKKEDEKLKQ